MDTMRKESDSLGVVEVPADKLWGAQTQRSLEHFSIGKDLMPREMITAYTILKKAAAAANHAGRRLDDERHKLIVQVCDEILAGQHHDMFPLHVWMTGSGTQFNMNVNEVISNRCCQLAGTPLGSKAPVHPNDHVNMAQSSNDTFPSAMYIAAAVNVKQRLIPAVTALHDAIDAKAEAWSDIVKIGRTHMQDATPLTLGQEWSGYAGMLADDLARLDAALPGWYGGGNRHQFGARFRRGGRCRDRRAHGPALRHRAQQVHGAGRPRRLGPAVGHASHPGGVALQDRQRHSPDVLRTSRRICGIGDPGE
jgi:fumarate hydratase class II